MVVMTDSTDPVTVAAIRKLDAIQQAGVHQPFDRPKDRGAPHARLQLLHLMPEFIGGEISSARRKLFQSCGNETALTCLAQPHCLQGG